LNSRKEWLKAKSQWHENAVTLGSKREGKGYGKKTLCGVVPGVIATGSKGIKEKGVRRKLRGERKGVLKHRSEWGVGRGNANLVRGKTGVSKH